MKLNTNLKDIQSAATTCLRDARCAFGSWPNNYTVCPIYSHDPSYTFSGGGYIFMAMALLDHKIDYDQSVAEYLSSCASCLACDNTCHIIRCHEPFVSILDIVRLMRREAANRGLIPEGLARKINEEVKTRGDYGQTSLLNLLQAAPGNPGDTVIFASCAHTLTQKEALISAVKLLEKMGTPVSQFAETGCCGSTLYDLGFWEHLAPLVAANWEKMKLIKDKPLVFINPHCQEFVTHRYPEIVSDFQPVNSRHISQVLAEALQNGKLKSRKTDKIKVSYHDPCYLGRGLKIYEPPRDVLKSLAGMELIEMPRNREDSFCCGAKTLGNYVPNLAADTAKARIDEFKATGAEFLITACDYCKEAFQRVLPAGEKERVKDLVDLVNERT
jgi:heterodisulfide reductase subunit D